MKGERMAKEYHINYSCDNDQDSSKSNIGKIQRLMRTAGAELITKDEEWEGVTSLLYHYIGTYGDAASVCQEAIDSVLHSSGYVSVNAYEHRPKIVIESKNVIDELKFMETVETIAKDNSAISIDMATKKSNSIIVEFISSKNAREFQNELTAKISPFIKGGIDGISISPEWEDVQILDKNNRPLNKKSSWTF